MSAPKQTWLPIETKVCEVCGYRKHPSGTYDRNGKWPHFCGVRT